MRSSSDPPASRAAAMRLPLQRASSRSRICDPSPASTTATSTRSLPRKLRRGSPSPVTMRARAGSRTIAFSQEEFVAHTSNVTCLSLGHKSGRVLVTGGDDKKVNLWAVGKPNCIMSLSGHMTAIECVRFGHTEELVCAGSVSGALKIWDLEAARLVRTLTGHRSNIRCMDFHPYGDFLASGSFDTNIKLWDTRRKGCIFTYKGHSLMVNSLKFSPDGQWIASAGEDGGVKIWDIRAGKMLTEFQQHSGAVVDVEFHPHEFLMATGGSDRVVNFWDLESFQLVTSSDSQCGAIRCVAFGEEADCLFAGCHDLLKVYGWEPFRCYDTVNMGWNKIADLAVAQTQLVGAAFQASSVSIYIVDLKKVQPYGRPSGPAAAGAASTALGSCSSASAAAADPAPTPFLRHRQSVRKSFIKDKPPDGTGNGVTVKTEDSSDTNVNTDPEEDSVSLVDVRNVHDYTAIFRPRNRALNRTPPPASETDSKLDALAASAEVACSPIAALASPRILPALPGQTAKDLPPAVAPLRAFPPSAAPAPPQPPSSSEPLPRRAAPAPVGRPLMPPLATSARQQPTVGYHSTPDVRPDDTASSVTSDLQHSPPARLVRHNAADPVQGAGPPPAPAQPPPDLVPSLAPLLPEPPLKGGATSGFVPMTSDRPAGLQVDDFLPNKFSGLDLGLAAMGGFGSASQLSGPSATAAAAAAVSESEALGQLVSSHHSMMAVLTNRRRQLEITHSLWCSKDARTALEHVNARNDLGVVVDVLGQLNLRPSIWNLDICQVVLPSIPRLLQSNYETYMAVGCSTLALILKNFAHMIKTNLASPVYTHGVDISREERYNKCKACYDELLVIRACIQKRQTLQGKIGRTFRELLVQMQSLD